jgi:exopolysaccharide biosynthesis WecB/TagA/CpsF family protein
MDVGRASHRRHFSGMDAAMEALAARARFDAPFAPASALLVDDGGNAALWLDDADAWETTGADVAQRLLGSVIERDEPVTIIGGEAEDVAALKRRYGLTDVRWRAAPARLRHNPDAILAAAEFAAAQESRIVLVCVGASHQEALARAIAHRGRARGVGLCVGAPLDVVCGRAERVPPWMRGLGLQWLHRLLHEQRP